MTDKTSVVTNISLSESPLNGPVDVIWSSTDFHHETCLPVIGSCQVSSILSTLEHVEPKSVTPEKRNDEHNNQNSDNLDTFKSIPINIINSDSILSVDEVKKRIKNRNENLVVLDKNKLFSEMMYFGCNLCPFICTKDNKISDHIKNVHRNKDNNMKPELKCPGCSNIFYHKLSLRSHLIHDHEVGRNDINKIVNSIVYVSVLSENNNLATAIAETNESLPAAVVDEEKKNDSEEFLNEDIHMREESLDNLGEDNNMESVEFLEHCSEDSEKSLDDEDIDAPLVVNEDYLPKQENSSEPNSEQLSNSRRGSFSKEEQKRTQKCCISTCAVRMNNVGNMSYHIKCHFGKIFRCLECNANFVVWKTLQTHLWRSHNIDMELYSCDKCDYKTYSLAKLNNIHKLIHGDEKPFLCDLCGKGFKNPKQLRNHKIIHKTKNIEKMQQCDICNRAFVDKRLLKVHIAAVHQKLKPFSCNYCGYKAASNGALKLHVRIHTGQKPFSCDSCDYSTADHNSLRRHKSRHSGEKKYKCAHCDYACIQSSTYKTHLKTKHPGMENELMFSCNYCQFRSVNKDKYMIHIASHKDKKDAQKLIDIIENICEDTEGLEERVVEIVTMKNKKLPDMEFANLNMKTQQIQTDLSTDKVDKGPRKQIQNFENMELRLQETPVALISKSNDITQNNHCIILPVQNENILNLTNVSTDIDNSVLPTTTAISTNSIQYFYSGANVLLEIIDEKAK